MRYSFLFCLILFLFIPSLSAEDITAPGFRSWIYQDQTQRPIRATLWYPTTAQQPRKMIGDTPIFQGSPVIENAPLPDKTYPLILLSHGSGGTIMTLGWLTSRLVAKGYLVAGINHPGTYTGSSTPQATSELAQRRQDLQYFLTELLDHPDFGSIIRKDQISALGFSLGGQTILSLAGIAPSVPAYQQYCHQHPDMPDCQWFATDPGLLARLDPTQFSQAVIDPRITRMIAIDPAFAQSYQMVAPAADAQQIYVIHLEADHTDWWPAVKINPTLQQKTKLEIDFIENARHLSFLALCQKDAILKLKKWGEKTPLCSDGPTGNREEIHTELADKIILRLNY